MDRMVEVVIISAQDLKNVRNFRHQSCYAVAYIHPQQKKATRLDKAGGVNPCWNSKLNLSCDELLLTRAGTKLTVEIYCHGSLATKLVGTVSVSLLDIAKEAKEQPKLMAFEVRRPSGKTQGSLNLSVKLGETRSSWRDPKTESDEMPRQGLSDSVYYQPQPWEESPPRVFGTNPQAHSQTGFGASYSQISTDRQVYPPSQVSPVSSGSAPISVYPPTSGMKAEKPGIENSPIRSNSFSKADELAMAYLPRRLSPNVYPPPNFLTTNTKPEDSVMVYPPLNDHFNRTYSNEEPAMVYPPRNDNFDRYLTEESAMTFSPTSGSQYTSQCVTRDAAQLHYPPHRVHAPRPYYPSAEADTPYTYEGAHYATNAPQQQYPPQVNAPQQYVPHPQANAPYSYQDAYYSKPARRQSGTAGGLLVTS